MYSKRLGLISVLSAMWALAAPALAADRCSPPRDLAPFPTHAAPASEIQRGVNIAYYLLALNWTPEWCRTNGEGITAQKMECGRPFGFTLHGLWPNGVGKPYPRYCSPVGGIDPATVRQMYCRTPSAELLQHEWAAHGACGWTDPRVYFAQARRLYDQLALPRIETIPTRDLTAGAVRRAFIRRNPTLRADQIYVQLDKDQRLTEVRLCFDLHYRMMSCMGGVGAPDPAPIRLTPSVTRAF